MVYEQGLRIRENGLRNAEKSGSTTKKEAASLLNDAASLFVIRLPQYNTRKLMVSLIFFSSFKIPLSYSLPVSVIT